MMLHAVISNRLMNIWQRQEAELLDANINKSTKVFIWSILYITSYDLISHVKHRFSNTLTNMKTIVLGLTLFLVTSTGIAQENNPFHFAGDLLSDEDPGSKEYDHDAFLGEDIADEFDDLVPEESQKRLG